jgi:hypothetical protein
MIETFSFQLNQNYPVNSEIYAERDHGTIFFLEIGLHRKWTSVVL